MWMFLNRPPPWEGSLDDQCLRFSKNDLSWFNRIFLAPDPESRIARVMLVCRYRCSMKNVRRPSSVVHRGVNASSCRPSSVNFLHVSSSSWKRMVGFYPNLAGIILRGRGFQVVQIVCVAPMGAQGEGPKGPKPCKFQTSSSPDPEGEESSYVVCRYLVRWRTKFVHGSSQGGPDGPLWALCKK